MSCERRPLLFESIICLFILFLTSFFVSLLPKRTQKQTSDMKRLITLALTAVALTACSQIKKDDALTEHLQHPVRSTLSFHETYNAGEYLTAIFKNAPEGTFLMGFNDTPMAGYVAASDTAKFMEAMRKEAVRKALPEDCRVMLAQFKSDAPGDERDLHSVYLVKTSKNLSMWNVTLQDIYVSDDIYAGHPIIAFQLSGKEVEQWATMTRMNIGKFITIVFEDRVLCAPRVNSEITGGAASISSEFTKEQACSLVEEIVSKSSAE